MPPRSTRRGSKDLSSAQPPADPVRIQPDLGAARKRWQAAASEFKRTQDRLVRPLLKKAVADDVKHQAIVAREEAARKVLHSIRVRRARKRDSIKAAERKIKNRRREIDALCKEEAVSGTKLKAVQTELRESEEKWCKQIEFELSQRPNLHPRRTPHGLPETRRPDCL